MIGERIKLLRIRKGTTQEAMASMLGVTSQAISKWENNVTLPDISLLVPIADYFGVSVDYLLRELKDVKAVDPEKFIEVACKKDRNAWRCTVRNTSDRELERVKLKTYFYDGDGNPIDCRDNLVFDLEPGVVKSELLFSTVGAKAASIKIVVKSAEYTN